MTVIQSNKKMDFDARMEEAEVYNSMGLLVESRDIYKQILSDNPGLDPDRQESIRQKIISLKSKSAALEEEERERLSLEDISTFTEKLSMADDIPAILDTISSYTDLGLFKEAVSEYEKLFRLDYPSENIILPLLECLLKIYTPANAAKKIGNIIDESDLENRQKAQIKFHVGLEMEKMDCKSLASDLFESAKELDPDNNEIETKVDSLGASISYSSKYDYLLKKKLVTTDQLQQAHVMSKKAKRSVEYLLIEHFKINKEEVGKSLSYFYGCPFKNYDPEMPTPVELISNLKKPFLIHETWVPMNWEKDGINILINNPKDLSKIDHITTLLKTKKINLFVAVKEDIEAFIRLFFDQQRSDMPAPAEDVIDDFDLIPDVSFEEENDTEEEEDEFDEASGKVVKLVDQVLVAAYRKNASDIHVEPSPLTKSTNIRFRVDGVCQEYITVPTSMAKGILSRLKIMSGLDIAERRLPQDGKIKFKRKGIPPFELRLATLPTTGGFEDAVLRILAKAGTMNLEEMGLTERNLDVLKRIISQPYGLVLVVGPTGSGKTTTLHSALGYINKPGIKIWTAEDPVEITQLGLRQVESKPKIGLDFGRIMRAFLRADPDVIMIGEMRDVETASTGVEASLTGHLVFSTLHTNSAPETVIRLLDMGLNPLNFSDAFLGVLAQRLVRRLCPDCRKEYHPSENEFMEIVNDYGKERFETTGIEFTKDLILYRPEGCGKCSGTGYKGRLGIHEMMDGTPEIKRMIKKEANSEELFIQAAKDGMNTLKQDGIQKAFQGLTDINEVRRVCVT